MIKFIKDFIPNIKLTMTLKRRKIASKIASERAKKAHWASQHKIWNNETHKRMKASKKGVVV